MKTIEEVKSICKELKETAEALQEILSNEERNKFAMAFLQYVEETYRKDGDRYYFRNELIKDIHNNVHEVLNNFIHMTSIGQTYEK